MKEKEYEKIDKISPPSVRSNDNKPVIIDDIDETSFLSNKNESFKPPTINRPDLERLKLDAGITISIILVSGVLFIIIIILANSFLNPDYPVKDVLAIILDKPFAALMVILAFLFGKSLKK